MNDDSKTLKLIIAAFALVIVLLTGLVIILAIQFSNVKRSIAQINNNADIVSAIHSLKVVNGQNGTDGISIQGPPGMNGKDSQSTTTVIQQPVNGTNGLSAYDIWLQQGNSGTQQDFLNSLKPVIACPDLQFDGMGNYRCHTSDDWLSLGGGSL